MRNSKRYNATSARHCLRTFFKTMSRTTLQQYCNNVKNNVNCQENGYRASFKNRRPPNLPGEDLSKYTHLYNIEILYIFVNWHDFTLVCEIKWCQNWLHIYLFSILIWELYLDFDLVILFENRLHQSWKHQGHWIDLSTYLLAAVRSRKFFTTTTAIICTIIIWYLNY